MSTDFTQGFVEYCYQQGLSLDHTETLFRKHANASFLATPNIYAGFREALQHSGLSKAAMARYLTPDILAAAVDCRVNYGNDALSCIMRGQMGLPEPSMETVSDELQKVASALGSHMATFQSLPLQQQLLIASLVGAGVGGVKRMVMPNESDQVAGRGALGRGVRGAVRGAATGAGAAGGMALGGSMGGRKNRLTGSLLGGAAGALSGSQIAKVVTG